MNIMKAKRKPIVEWDSEFLGLNTEEILENESVKVVKVEAPLVERKRILIRADTIEQAADKLADAIISEGVLEA